MASGHFEIFVRKEHITDAIKACSKRCMVKEGVRQSVIGSSSITVDVREIRFNFGMIRYRYRTPVRVALMIAARDADESSLVTVRPFSFKLTERDLISAEPVRLIGPNPKARHSHSTRTGQSHPKRDRYHGITVPRSKAS